MQTTELMTPDGYDRALQIVAWCLVISGGLWLVTSVIGYFHRGAYNLTHAESGVSKDIRPDFLKVDKAKRDAALERGAAFDKVLDGREKAASTAKKVAKMGSWASLFAKASAVVGLITAILAAFRNVKGFQEGVEQVGSWDNFVAIIRENQIGAVIAAAVLVVAVVNHINQMKAPTK